MKSCPKEISLAENTLAVASTAPAVSTKKIDLLTMATATTSEWMLVRMLGTCVTDSTANDKM